MNEEILKYALANAVKFEGKANPGAVIGRVIQELKMDPKDAGKEVSGVVKEVNSMSLDDQKAKLEELGGVKEVKKEKREGLKELPEGVEGNVVLRIAPSPSGPMHIGHAYVAGLNYEYKKMYNGKFIVRLEDTNPDNIYPDAYDMIKEDANWLTENGVDEFFIQSDRIDIYYKYMEKLLNDGHAYVCDCDNEKFKEDMQKGLACPCRELEGKAQVNRFKDMFDSEKYSMGDVVIRFKSDIKHKNPAMRDFPLMRINDSPHPRVGNKYRVWPLMNLSVAVDDMEMGVTHALRGKDHADNARRQEMIHKALDCKTPVPLSVGRINFEGFEVSCSKTKERIDSGEFNGWDDIRIPFLPALKRRGYHPKSLIRYAVDIGVTKVDKSVDINEFFKSINAHNKDLIDPVAYRYFFIPAPVEVEVSGASEDNVELDLHPDNKKGGRKFNVCDKFLLMQEDIDEFNNGETVRLMDCFNFKFENGKYVFDSKDYSVFKEKGRKIIHWLPNDNSLVDVEVLMPEGVFVKGKAEGNISSLELGSVVQFERFGFCRFDSIEEGVHRFWFTHK